jgi:hypothetical protein
MCTANVIISEVAQGLLHTLLFKVCAAESARSAVRRRLRDEVQATHAELHLNKIKPKLCNIKPRSQHTCSSQLDCECDRVSVLSE